jgi:hypothetical protein
MCFRTLSLDASKRRGAGAGGVPARRCPRQESNLHPTLRRRVLYPLSYEGRRGKQEA